MRIDIWSELICPWCYVGKRRFERALAAFPHRAEVEIVHRSFQLDPTIERGTTVSQLDRLMRKYGMSEARVNEMEAQMERIAAGEGLEFHRRGGVIGNTLDGHRLLHFAKARGLQDAAIERLYRAHFTEQRSIFDEESLAMLAGDAGLDPVEARRVLATDAYADAVAADVAEARALRVSGVPFFAIDRRHGISGAQPTEVFADALERAWAAAGAIERPVTAREH